MTKDIINPKAKPYLKEVLIGLVILIAVCMPFLHNIENRLYHHDENHWIHTSKYFKLFFIDRDFHNPQWKEWWTWDQPSVGRYIIGISLYLDGGEKRFEEVAKMAVWKSSQSFLWNTLNGALPMKDILYRARLPMAILGGLTCFLIYLAGTMLFNRWTGILAALLLAYNPLMLESSQRAMTDSPLIFFMTASMVLMIFFYQSINRRKHYTALGLSLLIGVAVALAAGSKMNGALAGITFGTFCILLSVFKIKQLYRNCNLPALPRRIMTDMDLKTVSSCLIISGLTSILLFTALNPYLYKQPLKGFQKMVEHRMETAKNQQKNWTAIHTAGEKFRFVTNRSLYDARYTTLKSVFHLPLDLILFITGLVILFYTETRHVIQNGALSMKSIVLVWTLITYIGIMVWIPLDWDRYYLPVVPCVAMMCAFGTERFIAISYNYAKRGVLHAA